MMSHIRSTPACVSSPGVVDVGMAVVDLEEPLLRDHRQFLGGDGVAEVRVVQVAQDRSTQPPGLLLDGGQVVLHRLDDAAGRPEA